jgi:uncharacterized protein (DUF1919 family)
MRAERGSLIQQLIGRKITIISRNLVGTVIYAEIAKQSRSVNILLRVKRLDKLSYKSITEDKEISLSLTGLLKDVRLHALI